jgi:hypothetical protein
MLHLAMRSHYSFKFLILAAACTASLVQAQSSNRTSSNSTSTANDRVGWISSSGGRGTLDIIWSCVSVLLICSYKCVHLNIPSFEEKAAGWHKVFGVPYWPELPLLRKLFRPFQMMAFVLIAPECGVIFAFLERQNAKAAVQSAKAKLTHLPREYLTMTHGFYANMAGFAAEAPAGQNGEKSRFRLSLEEYTQICERDSVHMVTGEDLRDRSKSDAFTKLFAIMQSMWLILQCIARFIEALPISELELTTIAYILCAVLMYGYWWDKPFGVEHVVVVQLRGSWDQLHGTELDIVVPLHNLDDSIQRNISNSSTISALGNAASSSQNSAFRDPVSSALDSNSATSSNSSEPSSTQIWARENDFHGHDLGNILVIFKITDDGIIVDDLKGPAIFYGTATIFSAIHLAAWNWDFPSSVFKWLWRGFAIGAVFSGFLQLCSQTIWSFIGVWVDRERLPRLRIWLYSFSNIICLALYVICRIGLMVLTFVLFFSMPAKVYDTVSWTNYFPHFW